jgi:competence protein ComFC
MQTFQGETCSNCQKNFAVDQLLIVSYYKDELMEKALKTYKYSFVQDISFHLERLTAQYFQYLKENNNFSIFDEQSILTWTPLSKRRSNWRGFNQAELIAKRISERFSIPSESLLIKKEGFRPQAEIEHREERLKNLSDAFNVTPSINISGKHIIIVDDVCTTGSTLNECAKVLKLAGAKKVTALVMARG